jgi:hypothetical protein
VVSDIGTYRGELTARLRLITEDFAWAAQDLDAEGLRYKPSDSDWSIHEHVSHLRDMEQEVYLPLLRWATVPDMLDPRDYNRRDWHEHRYRPDEPLSAMLADLARMRDEEVAVFREMDDATWVRWREDTRWGPVTCQWIAELMYRHVLDHLQGVMALRQDINLEAWRPVAARTTTDPFARRT